MTDEQTTQPAAEKAADSQESRLAALEAAFASQLEASGVAHSTEECHEVPRLWLEKYKEAEAAVAVPVSPVTPVEGAK